MIQRYQVLSATYSHAAGLCYSEDMTDDEFKQWLCYKGLTKERDHAVLLGKIAV